MEIFTNPDISIIVSIISLILAVVGIYIGVKNTNKKSLFFMHFENSQFYNPELLKETELLTTLDDRLKSKGLNKLVVYLSNDSSNVIELTDWSKDFKVSLENEDAEIQSVRFFSTNQNTLASGINFFKNNVSFKVGELEPEDILKAEIKYFSNETQKGKYLFKLRGRKNEEGEFLADHKIVEDVAENRFFNTHMIGTFPITVGLLYFSLYHLILACFKLKTADLVNFFKTESFVNISIVSVILIVLLIMTIPLVIKIHSAFVPYYRKLKKTDEYYEIKELKPAPNNG